MLTNSLDSLVFIFFKITIFLLLVIQTYQLLKQYVVPFLRKQIAIIEEEWKHFKNKRALLSKTKHRLKEQIKTQETTLHSLEKNIEKWHAILKKKEKEQEQLYAKQCTILYKKKEQQGAYLCFQKLKQETIATAIEQAKYQLIKKHASEKGKISLKHVFDDLITSCKKQKATG